MQDSTSKKISRRTLVASLVALGLGLAISMSVRAQAIEIKLGHVSAPGSLFAVSSEEFAKRANAKLGSKAKVVVFGSSQLGGDSEMVQKLKLGTIDLALPSSVMTSQSDLFGVFELPYLVQDRAHMQRMGNHGSTKFDRAFITDTPSDVD